MVRIVQVLCPDRHCIVGACYDDTDPETKERAHAGLASLLKTINPWCGICGSTKLEFEDMPTKYKTLEDARPDVTNIQAKNLEAMAHYARAPKNN
jgi:hypothetical protein